MTDTTTKTRATTAPKGRVSESQVKGKRKGPGSGKPPPPIVVGAENFDQFFPPEKRKPGAPTKFTDKLAAEVIAWVSEGRSLRSFCLQPGKPHASTVRGWMVANPRFKEEFEQAREGGIELLAEAAVDDAALKRLPPDQVPGARLAFDARRWYASKLHRKFADKVDLKAEVNANVVGALQIDVLLSAQVLTPERLPRLTEAELDAWQVAISTLPKLMAPTHPSDDPNTVEGEYTPIEVNDDHVQRNR